MKQNENQQKKYPEEKETMCTENKHNRSEIS